MTRRRFAQVRVLKLPRVHPGAVRVEVACEHGTTGLSQVPGPMLALTRAQMVTAAVFAHEERCGLRDTGRAHERGDRRVREITDRAWEELLNAAVLRRGTEELTVRHACHVIGPSCGAQLGVVLNDRPASRGAA